MNCLIIGGLHHKNKIGLELILKYLNYNYKFGNINDINNFDIIYMPGYPINTANYPKKKFIFGPHFSVFPTRKLLNINNIHNNSIYIQPSEWAADVWINKKANVYVPVVPFPFPVATERFKPLNSGGGDKVFIYFKSRKQEELDILTTFLDKKNIIYELFDYIKRYDEKDYIKCLQESAYGIWLGRHESQGFALEEALSYDVPLLVWDVTSMNQEEGYNYDNIPATCIPYWDERCGEIFYKREEFESKFDEFISKLGTYKPREYILENLSIKECAENLKRLIQEIKPNEIK